MYKIAIFDVKSYDKVNFEKLNTHADIELTYFTEKLTKDSVKMAEGFDSVCVFVNDNVCKESVMQLKEYGIKNIFTRSAGFNQIDVETCKENNINVLRVPQYSPNSIAEFAVTLLMTVNRNMKIATKRTTNHNFTLNGLDGIDIYQKTVGVIGTGKIGKIFAEIMRGFGANVITFDKFQDQEWAKNNNIQYKELDEVLATSDVLSLHVPLFAETHHLINEKTISQMKPGVIIVNSSRGALVDTEALITGIEDGKIRGYGTDVYEFEQKYFFENFENEKMEDEVLKKLISLDNVVVTAHQAFFTEEALTEIYTTTLNNVRMVIDGKELVNKVD